MLAAFAAPAFAATNPFMDVPASHWAYDAVAQLAARGVISGYPDGTFKGPQPATRYEIASIIARSLAYVDMDKASKADVEMMRRLIVEFSDELSALGVTVDGIDARLGALEADLGGWKFSGVFEFNAKFGEDRESGKADWDLDKYRVFIDKRINETTAFHARLGKDGGVGANGHADGEAGVTWDYYYITTKLGYDIELTAGRFGWDWEGDLGFYIDDDAWMNDTTRQGFGLKKDFGIASFALLLQRLSDDDYLSPAGVAQANAIVNVVNSATGVNYLPQVGPSDEWYRIALNLNADFNEKFSAGLLGYFDLADEYDDDVKTFGGYLKFRFHPSVELKGLYYYQDAEVNNDHANAWKAVLDINQDLLKFTSLWIEYAQVDADFIFDTGDTEYAGYANFDADPSSHVISTGDKYKFILVKASQQWNDKWDSWVRYNWADYDGGDDFNQIGVGIGYQLNPAVHFELGYDHAKYNDGEKDNLVRFQTIVNF
jgi:hypothetical protein